MCEWHSITVPLIWDSSVFVDAEDHRWSFKPELSACGLVATDMIFLKTCWLYN